MRDDWFSKTALTASPSPVSTTASTTGSVTDLRRATATRARLFNPRAIISSRSRSLSSGEYSSTGTETISSRSSASRNTMSWGTFEAFFSSSDMIARMRGSSSLASTSSTSSVISVTFSFSSGLSSGIMRPILWASSARTSSSLSLDRIRSACSGVPTFSATSRRTSGSSSVEKKYRISGSRSWWAASFLRSSTEPLPAISRATS